MGVATMNLSLEQMYPNCGWAFQDVRNDNNGLNPYEREDAWYIVCHPKDFNAETLKIANETYEVSA
jgi:hypothetical protein